MASTISLSSSLSLKSNANIPNKSMVSLSSPMQLRLPLFSPRHQTLKLSSSVASAPLPPLEAAEAESLDNLPNILSNQTIEHIVLFKMKYGFSKFDYTRFIEAMNSLKCLPGVLYLTSGYIHDIHCAPYKEYTVFLHSRHATKADMDTYMTHPLKHAFTMTYTEPFFEDYMLVDYVHEHDSKLDHPEIGHALRTIFIQLKDGWAGSDEEKQEETKAKVKAAISKCLEELGIPTDKTTFGESYEGNGYPAAHKNFQIGVLASYPTLAELETTVLVPKKFSHDLAEKLEAARVPLVPDHGVIVVDYEVKEVYVAPNVNS